MGLMLILYMVLNIFFIIYGSKDDSYPSLLFIVGGIMGLIACIIFAVIIIEARGVAGFISFISTIPEL